MAQSFRAESVMDYWVGKDKVKGTVWVMGKVGARLRFNAINPDAGSTAVDLACDGTSFQYIDYHNNCQLTGPCTRDAIRQLLGVSLEPDDFLLLAIGSTPVIGPSPRAKVEWDAERGAWKLSLVSSDDMWQQTIYFSHPEHDILESEVRDARGQVEWRLTNKGFKTVKGAGGETFRVPERTRFEKPKEKADLIVRWKQRDLNLELGADKFTMSIPPGLPRCGQRQGQPAAGGP